MAAAAAQVEDAVDRQRLDAAANDAAIENTLYHLDLALEVRA